MNIGVDIVEISKIKNFVDGNIDSLSRIFSAEEIKYCGQKKHVKSKYQSYAARFAAKEAFIKALDDKTINFCDISVENKESGKPVLKILDDKYKNLKTDISLSHSDNYAVAMVVIY